MKSDLEKIHKTSVRILEDIGVRFHHPGALNLLESNGIKISDDRAFFTEEQIMKWVGESTSRIHSLCRQSKLQYVSWLRCNGMRSRLRRSGRH